MKRNPRHATDCRIDHEGERLALSISSSKSSNPVTNTDARVVGGDSSSNLSLNASGNRGAVNVTVTDAGAVSKSLDLAMKGIEGAQATASAAVADSGELLRGVLATQGEQQQQFADALENIKTSDVRVLIFAGLAVVGLAAVQLAKKA